MAKRATMKPVLPMKGWIVVSDKPSVVGIRKLGAPCVFQRRGTAVFELRSQKTGKWKIIPVRVTELPRRGKK